MPDVKTTPLTESINNESLSTKVVTEVAAAKDVSPMELRPPLYEAIDPSALDALFDDRNGASCVGQVAFRYNGFDVTVESSGEVILSDSEDAE